MRLVYLFCVLWSLGGAKAPPPALVEALKTFRTDPPKGWSFLQTTTADSQSTVERSDATKSEFDRWTLVQKDGRIPTENEVRTYNELRSRRSRGGTAPKLVEQLNLESLETLVEAGNRATYRCRLRPGEAGDKTAPFLRAVILFHHPTRTIESIELESTGEFSPTFGVRIARVRTTMTYSLPTAEAPSLPQKVTTHVRGSAFLLKKLDADMTVTFSEYVKAGKR